MPKNLITASFIALASTLPLAAQQDDARIKELALEAILENPEIIAEAIQILQEREQEEQRLAAAEVFEANKVVFLSGDNAPVIGNPDGDVTIVEFFDYNCSYCRRAFEAVRDVIEEDGNIRVVMREFPILGPGSDYAAKASLAAMKQGKYSEFHWALMDSKIAAYSIKEEGVLKVAEEVGLDLDQMKVDMEAPEVAEHITLTREYASALQFTGTPAFIIGDQLVPGFVDAEVISQIIPEARAEQG